MRVKGGSKVLMWLWSFHRYRLFNGDNPKALVKVIGLESSDIGKGKSAINVYLVIIFEKQGSDTPLTHVSVVKASIQGTEMSVCQSTLDEFYV